MERRAAGARATHLPPWFEVSKRAPGRSNGARRLERKLVALSRASLREGACGQLDALLGPEVEPRRPPGAQPGQGAHHAPAPIEEDGVDREPHEQGVDR